MRKYGRIGKVSDAYMSDRLCLSDLEKGAALQVLVHLFRNGRKASRTDFRDNIDAAMETVYSALGVLERYGLIEEEKTDRLPFFTYTHLTQRGFEVAKHLDDVEKILQFQS